MIDKPEMSAYVNLTVQMATLGNRGVINDHLDVSPDFGSDLKARREGDPSLRRYCGFLRREFNVADGPQPGLGLGSALHHPRNYQRASIEFRDLPLEEALERAREIADTEKVVLYLEREFPETLPSPCYRRIVSHPEGWEPQEG